jgi:hypothetical protein
MDVLELRFLLKLLGFPGYRAPLSRLQISPRLTAVKRQQLCRTLCDRGWIACSEEIVQLQIAPPGKALLKLKIDQLPISELEKKVLQATAQQPISPGKTGIPAADRTTIIEGLANRGLIQLETRVKEVWLTEQGKVYLCTTYDPKGSAAISLDSLRNYLRLLRQSVATIAISQNSASIDIPLVEPTDNLSDRHILQMIQTLDRELGTQNYLPLFHLRQKLQPPLTRQEFDQTLYRLQREDQIELSSLQEAIAYTPEQVHAGIPQDIGGPLFFISINQ